MTKQEKDQVPEPAMLEVRVDPKDLLGALGANLVQDLSTSRVDRALDRLSRSPELATQTRVALATLAKQVLAVKAMGRAAIVEVGKDPETGALIFRMI